MKLRLFLLLALSVIALGGCAALEELGGSAISKPGAHGPSAPGGTAGGPMDVQERELHARLAMVEGASIQRLQENLFVTLGTDVLFDAGSARLQPGAHKELGDLAEILVRFPGTQIRIDAHTDVTGTEEKNYELSEMRAGAVREALIERGVEPRRITARGWGESKPVATNATEEGRRQNRRVTVVISPVQT
jgi:outer membrane protein OmpA-like peptidoglycan-associated protein